MNELRKNGIECKGEIFPPVPPVNWDDDLEKVAQVHCNDMFEKEFVNHKGSNGFMVWDRAEKIGFEFFFIGKNIAQGQMCEQDVVDDWLTSKSHCAVIMKPEFTKMGVAIKGDYWTQVFAH